MPSKCPTCGGVIIAIVGYLTSKNTGPRMLMQCRTCHQLAREDIMTNELEAVSLAVQKSVVGEIK